MSSYSDGNITINSESLIIRDGLIPKVGVISINLEEIASVEIIKLSLLQKLTLYGTNNFKTLYSFDLKRVLKKEALKVTVTDPLGPFSEFVINPKNLVEAHSILVNRIK